MMVFQEFDQLLPWKTVKQNVMFALTASGKLAGKAAEDKALEYIAKVNLAKFADSYPHTLSGGMKQRVAIARGMAMEPDVLLMDEPFAALDALTRRKMQDELLQLWDDTHFTVLFVTHSIPEAIKIGSRILLLSPHPGQVKAEINSLPRDAAESEAAKALEGKIHTHAVRRRSRRGRRRHAMRPSDRCDRAAYPVARRRPWLIPRSCARMSFARLSMRRNSASSRSRLSTWERIYNIAAVRKLAILVLLALVWEVYARWLNNPLLFPTFTSTLEAFYQGIFGGGLLGKAWTSIKVLLIGYSAGIALAALLTVIRDHVAHRHRFPRNADLDVQPAACHRAAAARPDLVRPRQRQPGLRADPLGAVGGRPEHAFGFPFRVQHDAHGRPQLRPARTVVRWHGS